MISWLGTHLRVGPFFCIPIPLHSDAGSDSKGGCHGGQNGDKDIQYFTPKLFVFHSLFEL